MRNNKNKPNFTFRIIKDGKTVDKCQTHSKRRFYNRIRTINWQNNIEKMYLRVSYGKSVCNCGCLCSFYNDGEYFDKAGLLYALTVFAEDL